MDQQPSSIDPNKEVGVVTPLTEAERARMEEICNKVPSPPWNYNSTNMAVYGPTEGRCEYCQYEPMICSSTSVECGEFIAEVRSFIPRVLEALEVAEREVVRLKGREIEYQHKCDNRGDMIRLQHADLVQLREENARLRADSERMQKTLQVIWDVPAELPAEVKVLKMRGIAGDFREK